MSTLPLVSIITPTYNRASYLCETIESVLGQDYPNIEYIVLDDGSTDNTLEILKKYNGRLTWLTHPNMGEARTVNKGWSMAHGDILAVVNSDDPILPGAVSSAVAVMREHPDVLVAYGDWNIISTEPVLNRHIQVREYDYLYMVKRHYCTVGPGAFIQRRALDLAGVRDEEFAYVGDFEFWLRLGLYGKFCRVPGTLATWREHPTAASVSQKGAAMAHEHIRVMQKLYSRKDLPPDVRKVRREAFSWAYYTAACVAGKARLLGISCFIKSVLYYPTSFGPGNFHKILDIVPIVLPVPVVKLLIKVKRALKRGKRRPGDGTLAASKSLT